MNIQEFYNELYRCVKEYAADKPLMIAYEDPNSCDLRGTLRASIHVRGIYSHVAPSTTFVMNQQDNVCNSIVYLHKDADLCPSGAIQEFDNWAIAAFMSIAVEPLNFKPW